MPHRLTLPLAVIAGLLGALPDAECDFSTADSKEGTIYPALYSGCLTALTDERTGQLNGYLNCEEGDMSCPVPPAP